MTVRDGIATVALPHRRFEPAMLLEKELVAQVTADYLGVALLRPTQPDNI